jgi:hypothetical protein
VAILGDIILMQESSFRRHFHLAGDTGRNSRGHTTSNTKKPLPTPHKWGAAVLAEMLDIDQSDDEEVTDFRHQKKKRRLLNIQTALQSIFYERYI